MLHAHPARHAVQSVGLQSLNCWDRGFESRRNHACFVFVVFCVGSGFCVELITLPKESYRVCVCVIIRHLETSEAAWALFGLLRHNKIYDILQEDQMYLVYGIWFCM